MLRLSVLRLQRNFLLKGTILKQNSDSDLLFGSLFSVKYKALLFSHPLFYSALAEMSMGKKNVIVPYRDSSLTKLLHAALGGNSKTIMVSKKSNVCFTPDIDAL